MKMREVEYGTTIALWSGCGDRFLSQGYKEQTTFRQKIETMAKIEDIKGVDLYGDWDVNPQNVEEVKEILTEFGLKTFIVTADLNSIAEFGRGSVTSPLAGSRELAFEKIKDAVDMAQILDCDTINVWYGQDGYDYSFQTDFLWAWERLIESTKDAAKYAKDKGIKVALEYKPREPRTHIFTASVAKTLLIIKEVDEDNVGIVLDTGHAYAAGENIAESVAILKTFGDKLFYVHVNDNYKVWDDDMMVGAVHPFELVEFIYWLEKTDYSGPIVLDMFPYREDPQAAARESIELIKRVRELLSGISEDSIEDILKKQDATEALKMLRKSFLK